MTKKLWNTWSIEICIWDTAGPNTLQTLCTHTWRGLWSYPIDTVLRVFPLWWLSGQEIIFTWCGPLKDMAWDQSGLLCVCVSDALMVSFLSPWDQFSSSYTECPQWSPSKICFAKRSPVSCAGKSHKLPVPAFDIILFSVQYVSADFGNCDEFGLLSRLFTPPTSPMRSRPLTQDKSLLCYYFICGGFVAASKQQSMMG